jgi:hypothetical protein
MNNRKELEFLSCVALLAANAFVRCFSAATATAEEICAALEAASAANCLDVSRTRVVHAEKSPHPC